MRCPICSKEMALGYLDNPSQPVQWIPEGKRPSMWNFTAAKDGIKLKGSFSIFKGYRAPAHYCRSCRIVVAETEVKAY